MPLGVASDHARAVLMKTRLARRLRVVKVRLRSSASLAPGCAIITPAHVSVQWVELGVK